MRKITVWVHNQGTRVKIYGSDCVYGIMKVQLLPEIQYLLRPLDGSLLSRPWVSGSEIECVVEENCLCWPLAEEVHDNEDSTD
jgi:hypothetical protein